MRKFFFNLHLYTGLIAGLFIVLLGITGSLMAFEPEINHLVHYTLSYVEPGNKTLSLTAISQKVNNAFPHDTITGYELSAFPDLSWQVYLQQRWVAPSPGTFYLERKSVFVNPYNGNILGVLTRPDHWDDWQNTIHQLHLRLALRNGGDTGKRIMSWVGLGLLLLQLTGLCLWWKQRRFTIRWKNPSRRVWFDVHNSVGIFSFIFMLLLTITGMLIGFEKQTTPLLFKITGSKPSEVPDFKVIVPRDARPLSPDSALGIAREAIPGAEPFSINVPDSEDVFAIRSRFPEDRTPGGRSKVFIDQYTGKVLFVEGSRTAPAGTRIINANRAIHTGDIFGIPSKIIMSLASLSVVLLFISGATMWWTGKKWS